MENKIDYLIKTALRMFFLLAVIFIPCQYLFAEEMTADDYFNRARQKYAQGDLDSSVADFKKSLNMGKNEADVKNILLTISGDYYSRSGEKYMNGDVEGAFIEIEKSLELKKDDLLIKNFLGIYASELVSKYYNLKRYDKTLPYLGKLLQLFPEEEEYKKMYDNIKRHLSKEPDAITVATEMIPVAQKTVPVPAETVPAAKQEKIQRKRIEYKTTHKTDKNRATKAVKTVYEIPNQEKIEQSLKLVELLEARLKNQDELLNSNDVKNKELLQKILANAARERKEMEGTISSKTIEMKRILTFIAALVGIIVIIAIIAGFLFIVRPAFIFSDGKKEIAGSANGRAKDLKGKKLYRHGQGIDELKLLETEVVDRQTDSQAAEKVLQPFLESPDSKVNAEAAKALFRHNPARALDILEKMESSPDKRARLNAIHALGEINSPEAVKLLLDHLDEKEIDVKKEVIKSLQIILELKKELLPEYLREKIEKELQEVKIKGTWIIE